jgi:pyridoxal phosphate enzyme (YggS family)
MLHHYQEIGARLASLRDRIQKTCHETSRDPKSVHVIAVSKGHDFQAIKKAYDFGQRDFGESYAQDLDRKISEADKGGLNDIIWHFIGALQTNKIQTILKAKVIHSVGSLKHAALLNQKALKIVDIFLQVNLDSSPKRQGFYPADVTNAVIALDNLRNLSFKGLMCIAPQDHLHSPSYWFHHMANLKNEIIKSKLKKNVALSMGMSSDFADAILCGSNYVRSGTSIFGERATTKQL